MTDHIKAIEEDVKLVPGLEAAIRAAKLALFVIRKQNVMPNSSWEDGFNKDLAIAEAALTAAGEMWKTSYEFKGVSLGDENSPRIVTNAIVTNAPASPVEEDVVESCHHCGGCGYEIVSVAVCCEKPTRFGECCANPVEGQQQKPCPDCGGTEKALSAALASPVDDGSDFAAVVNDQIGRKGR